MRPKIKIQRYYGLQLIAAIYKILAFLTVILSIGSLGFVGIQFFNLPDYVRMNVLKPDYQIGFFVYQMLAIIIGGGLLALTFFVIAQVIGLQLAMNDKLRLLVEQSHESDRKVIEAVDILSNELRASRLKLHINQPNTQLPSQSQTKP